MTAMDRRRFLWHAGGGLGGIALSWLLGEEGLLGVGPPAKPQAALNGGLHHRARARRVVAPNGPANWGAAFLPAAHQGTMIRPGDRNPINDLFPPEEARASKGGEADGLALLRTLNERHRAGRAGDSRLEARIASYEL